ncbi:tyrosine-type recombinase/integrase [Anaeromyxobacter oryzisoli]|uniref:tyrosine-type recombinase/integrase n=1 Tax=Anaeromyxobacter oryzisoli TaxID=2925408 RepID=UPI001F56D8B6|nr:tyrosine-type recombinase/integrase [Anaeromyxobacter sp. SG63]
MPWVGPWRGGRVWQEADGTRVYYIRRKISGRTYEVSTRCTNERSALEHLERFERDPDGYDPGTALAGEPILLSTKLALDFLRWSRDGKGNSGEWVGKQRSYLAWWQERIGAKDLRRITLGGDLVPALDGAPGRKQRIEVVKAFYAWLREERHVLRSAEDPTLDLAVPQGRPEQWKTPKAIPVADHRKVMAKVAAEWRPHLLVLAGTGWHVAELQRFAASGAVGPLPKSARRVHGAAAVLTCPRRKSGEVQRTAVSKDVAAAARKVLKRGAFQKKPFYLAVAAACTATKVTKFEPGQYRHSVATWAIERGDDPAAVAAFLGHKSPATTRRFYATLAVAPKVRTLA